MTKIAEVVHARISSKPGIPSVLILGCEKARTVLEIREIVQQARISVLYDEDSDFLLAERLLKDYQGIRALDSKSFKIALKNHEKFDAIIQFADITSEQNLNSLLELSNSKLSAMGVILMATAEKIDQEILSKAAERFGFEIVSDMLVHELSRLNRD